MAAEAATFLAHTRTGDHIVCIGDVYGGTFELLGDNLPQHGITTTFLRADEVGRLPEVLTDHTRIVFFETPSNPTLDLFDIATITGQAHTVGALSVVDNTFATPVNQNPLRYGADLVTHSATKYLGGHSDLTRAAHPHHDTTTGTTSEVVVERHDPVHLGHRQVQHIGDHGHVRRINAAKIPLDGMQDRQERTTQAATPQRSRTRSARILVNPETSVAMQSTVPLCTTTDQSKVDDQLISHVYDIRTSVG